MVFPPDFSLSFLSVAGSVATGVRGAGEYSGTGSPPPPVRQAFLPCMDQSPLKNTCMHEVCPHCGKVSNEESPGSAAGAAPAWTGRARPRSQAMVAILPRFRCGAKSNIDRWCLLNGPSRPRAGLQRGDRKRVCSLYHDLCGTGHPSHPRPYCLALCDVQMRYKTAGR